MRDAIDPLVQATRLALSNIGAYSRYVTRRELRAYQVEPAEAIVSSIVGGHGRTFVVEMSRQAGKNELSAQLEAYLLTIFQRVGGQIVKASPTFKPQTLNSLQRLKDRLKTPWHAGRVRHRSGYIVEVGEARAMFFSAEPRASTVGATADLLLEGDEAQDIKASKWDKDFEPMKASTNATSVLWGTAWTTNTLLYQAKQAALRQQAKDGVRRYFEYPADVVAQYVPAYAAHVADRRERLGARHPLIVTQYDLKEIDHEGGLFPDARQALMRGTHERRRAPEPGKQYALLVDVAGEDEEQRGSAEVLERDQLANKKRDATAITVVEMGPGDQWSYLVRDRSLFLGVPQTALYERINALVAHWSARWLVVDATGVGAGLASFLEARWSERVVRFEFSSASKSDLGWDFVGVIETGRFKDHADDQSAEYRQFWYEVDKCQYEVLDGPGQRLRWGVTEPPAYDGLVARGHDDLLISAAFTAVLDKQPKPTEYFGAVVQVEKRVSRRRGKY